MDKLTQINNAQARRRYQYLRGLCLEYVKAYFPDVYRNFRQKSYKQFPIQGNPHPLRVQAMKDIAGMRRNEKPAQRKSKHAEVTEG